MENRYLVLFISPTKMFLFKSYLQSFYNYTHLKIINFPYCITKIFNISFINYKFLLPYNSFIFYNLETLRHIDWKIIRERKDFLEYIKSKSDGIDQNDYKKNKYYFI